MTMIVGRMRITQKDTLGSSSRINDRSARIEGDGHSPYPSGQHSARRAGHETISSLTALASSFGLSRPRTSSSRKEINKPEIPKAQAQ